MASRLAAAIILLTLLGTSIACSRQKTEHLITGKTMGTTYHIKVVGDGRADVSLLRTRIASRLSSLNQSMSTYRADSEISKFNRSLSIDQPFPVSKDFYNVMVAAADIYKLTQGAWDGTVKPLVDVWGFGAPGGIDQIPDPQTIERTMENVGFDHIDLTQTGALRKHRSGIAVDLGSIAKGYGVDVIAREIGELGYTDYLVEIGGEVYAAGRRPDGKAWRVGINQPDKSAPINAVYIALSLENQAMATSGDYRNYIEIDGHTFSHIIDPRSGYPVNNGVVSVSVIAPTCTLADGLATAVVVMGAKEGLALLDRLDQVEGLVLVRTVNGGLQNYLSKGMQLQASPGRSPGPPR